jgi:glutathione S-transferase
MTASLKIWGRMSSINVKKVVWAAQELGLDFERIDAGRAFGNINTPEYLRHNPNGAIPLIDDDGFMLWESNVIVRYLCAKQSRNTLYPDALHERFNAERWMDWQQAHLNPAGRDAFVQWFRTPIEERRPDLIEQSVTTTEPYMAMLDSHLGRNTFMAGDQFTMADIPIGCEIHRWWGLPQARPPRPHIDRWYALMQARPAALGILDLPLS